MNKAFFGLAIFGILQIAQGQSRPLRSLPHFDCSLTKVMGMIGQQTLFVSPDKAEGLEPILSDYCGTFGTNCVRKTESELADTDFTKSILAVGIASDFRKWNQFKIPVRISGKGFVINNKPFTDSSDGFAFVDSNRIIISGNSLRAIRDVQLALTGGHEILVLEKGKITFFGNRKGPGFAWYNLQDLKFSNYKAKTSSLFSTIYTSKTFKDTLDYPLLAANLEKFTKQFLQLYNIEMPVQKVSWFIHSNMQEYGTMSGMFGLTCPGNNSGGFSIRGEIHTLGCNTALVKHEYSHYLFDNSIPQTNNPAFFVEGAVEYVTSINDSSILRERYRIARQYLDTLNYAALILDNKDFYGQYSQANYSICGIFVQYLIDAFGVERFKNYCLAANKSKTTRDIYNVDFPELVSGYKAWLAGK